MASPIASLAARAVAAAASRQLATRIAGAQLGPIGTVATVALPFLLRRVSPLGMAAMAVGAWGVGRLTRPAAVRVIPLEQREPVVTPPPIAWSPPADAF